MSDNRYRIEEGSFVLPDECIDRTSNIFIFGNPEKSTLNFNIARDDVLPDETLSKYVERQLKVLKSKIKGYKLNSQQDIKTKQNEDDWFGIQIDAVINGGTKTIFQRQAVFFLTPQRALIFSASSGKNFDEQLNKTWFKWLGSFELAK